MTVVIGCVSAKFLAGSKRHKQTKENFIKRLSIMVLAEFEETSQVQGLALAGAGGVAMLGLERGGNDQLSHPGGVGEAEEGAVRGLLWPLAEGCRQLSKEGARGTNTSAESLLAPDRPCPANDSHRLNPTGSQRARVPVSTVICMEVSLSTGPGSRD